VRDELFGELRGFVRGTPGRDREMTESSMLMGRPERDINATDGRRIEQTVVCRDCDPIPKVPGAGGVEGSVQLMHNGVRVVAGGYYGDWMTEIIERLAGHHEPQEELAFHAVVERLAENPGAVPVVIELGAFWAYYALWVLHRMPAARAVLVEPDPAHLEVGRRNFDLNGREGLFIQAAVGAKPRPPEPFACESDGVIRMVPTESVSSVLATAGLERIDVLAVDVQGAELATLDGARPLIEEGRVRFVVVSTHHHSISGDPLTHQRCVDLIREAGGHVLVEHTIAESYSGDGLVVASFDPSDRQMEVTVSRARACDSLFGDPLFDLADAWATLHSLRYAASAQRLYGRLRRAIRRLATKT